MFKRQTGRKCEHCGNKGRCTCELKRQIAIAGPSGPKTCTAKCGANGKGEPCNAVARGGGPCPCAFC